jgi:hypothetical protein
MRRAADMKIAEDRAALLCCSAIKTFDGQHNRGYFYVALQWKTGDPEPSEERQGEAP